MIGQFPLRRNPVFTPHSPLPPPHSPLLRLRGAESATYN